MTTEQDVLNSINTNPNHDYHPDSQPEEKQSRGSEFLRFLWETAKIIFISLAIILPIRYYLVQPFFVKGASMEPNFEDGDYLLIDEISYRFHEPERGDVIVFRYPENPSQFFIKRVVGLPGETIEIKNNQVSIYNIANPKGSVLKEGYLASYQKTLGDMMVKLGGSEYFVLGDNRLQSSDSRRWGTLSQVLITGRVALRLYPFTHFASFKSVAY